MEAAKIVQKVLVSQMISINAIKMQIAWTVEQ